MDVHITEDELRILAYLHEHATGFGEKHAMSAKKLAAGLSIDLNQLARDASYLDEHGLVGYRTNRARLTSGAHTLRLLLPDILWLTGLGENYMRELEHQPGIARKLTVGAVGELWQAGKGIIASVAGQVLSEFLKHR